jgi:hypothetical protein
LLIVAIHLGLSTPAAATPTHTLVPFEDTLVIQRYPDTNFAALPALMTTESWWRGDALSLIYPDLSLIEADSVLDAVFEITRVSSCPLHFCEKLIPISVNPILEDWNPTEVTWRNRPSIGGAIDEQMSYASDRVGTVYRFDVTDLINACLADVECSGFGFALIANADSYGIRHFYGSTEGDDWSQPKLLLTPVPEPGTLLQVTLGFGMLGLSRRRFHSAPAR